MTDIVRLSKTLPLWLLHRPEAAGSDKRRFELPSDGSHIRARQGRSVAVEFDPPT